jgi:hypothetical protein
VGRIVEDEPRSVGRAKPGPAGTSAWHRWRLLPVIAAVSATVVATTLSLEGFAYVNLDSLLREALTFYGLLVVPASLVTVCLVVAALPRIVTINLAVFAGLLAIAEAGAWVMTPGRPVIRGEPQARGASSFYVPDPTLGYVMAPSTVARHRRTAGDTQIYDVTYQTDERGRRETPTGPGLGRASFLLFFGDSNTFGEGLSQTETLPYYAGELAAAWRPYNYGVSGYGPAQLLALARAGRLRREVPEPDGYAVFFLIPAHIGRVVGSSKVSTGWGRHFPYYEMNDRGALVAHGDFVHGRPLTTLAYYFWTKSHLAAYFGVDLPVRHTAYDYRLTARIFKESSRLLAQQVPLRGCVVVLGHVYNDVQLGVSQGIREALAGEGVAYLDYTRLFDTRDPQYRLSGSDYHNSAKANRIIATQLVADLGIARRRIPPREP